ncbi:MAG: ion transporter [Kofleriaceae bacterium]|nr:ion transporter [Kofleriaceae bacterium]
MSAENPTDPITKIVNLGLMLLIAANGIALILETVAGIYTTAPKAFSYFETISIAIFSAEYILRLWSCTELTRYTGAVKGRLRFSLSPMALVDLLAIAPFYLPFLGIDLRSARLLRLFRVFRMFKLARYSNTLKLFARIAISKKEELITVLVFFGIMLVVSSTLVYYVETNAQPETFSSIPATMWWAIATLTTVGYGDMYPVTELGKILGSFIAVLGIGLAALPAGILGSAFIEEVQNKQEQTRCPHCQEKLDRPREK